MLGAIYDELVPLLWIVGQVSLCLVVAWGVFKFISFIGSDSNNAGFTPWKDGDYDGKRRPFWFENEDDTDDDDSTSSTESIKVSRVSVSTEPVKRKPSDVMVTPAVSAGDSSGSSCGGGGCE